MSLKNKYKERRLKKIKSDISKIESRYYAYVEHLKNDIDAQVYAAENKKTLLVRAIIIENHLAIEDFLNSLLQISVLKINSKLKKKTAIMARDYINTSFEDAKTIFYGNSSIGFKRKIILLRMMGLIGKRLYEDLDQLNSLRNKCGHSWEIGSVIRRGVRRNKLKRFVLEYRGTNLFNPEALARFIVKYNNVLLKIAKKY